MKKILSVFLAMLLVLSACTFAAAETYSAEAQGFGGPVAVTLTIDGGKLTAVDVTADAETPGIGTRAVEMLPGQMVEGNTVAVDAVAGATVTSNAILTAAADALAKSGAALEAAKAAAAAMTPGVYQGSAKGFHGTLHAEVELAADEIVRVTVGENEESLYIGTSIFDYMQNTIVEHQTVADVITGATFTSNAINGAVIDAMKQAGANNATINGFMKDVPAPVYADEEADIVIVGAGTAGAVAAMTAVDGGADVVLLEKTGITGGSARLSAGCIWGVGMDETAEAADFSAGDIHEYFSSQSGPVYNNAVFYKVANDTRRNLEYLKENGFKNMMIYPSNSKNAPQFMSLIHEDMGAGFSNMLDQALEARNVDLRYNSRATELVIDDNGAVTGVVVEDKNGTYTIKAKKVILATGGFTHNPEMMAQYAAGRDKDCYTFTAVGATGDGHKMGLAAGGYFIGEGTLNLTGTAGRQDYKHINPTVKLLVDQKGEQMAAMDEHYSTICEKVTQQENGICYVLTDSDVSESAMVQLEKLLADGDAFKADTLEELAVLMGADAATLAAAVENHNKHYDEQTDDEWGTAAASLLPIKTAPYYAFRRTSHVMGTITGLYVDTAMRVMKESGEPVENLYATGELMFGNMFNTIYPMSGTALTMCITTGRLAAEDALAAIQ